MKSFFLLLFLFCSPNFALGLCVTADHASLRENPGAQQKVDWVVGQNMPFKKLARKGSWTQVEDMDGETHWVASSSVGEGECVVVKSTIAHLRQGPGTQFPAAELTVADKYTPFKKLEREGEWLQVADEYGEKYWINDSKIWYPVNHMSVTF